MSNKRSRNRQAGFTLIEVVVALTIFGTGILATLTVANFGFQASSTNEKTVAGLNIAREGIEAVRNIRDSNWSVMAKNPTNPPNNFYWDCLPFYNPASGGAPGGIGSPTPGCTYRMTDVGSYNYILYPQMDSGLWSVLRNSSGTATSTTDPLYQICKFTGSVNGQLAPFYTPKNTTTAPCTNEVGYYRRIVIERGKDLGGGRYNTKVTAYVSWPNKKGGDIILEEYLTDWREI